MLRRVWRRIRRLFSKIRRRRAPSDRPRRYSWPPAPPYPTNDIRIPYAENPDQAAVEPPTNLDTAPVSDQFKYKRSSRTLPSVRILSERETPSPGSAKFTSSPLPNPSGVASPSSPDATAIAIRKVAIHPKISISDPTLSLASRTVDHHSCTVHSLSQHQLAQHISVSPSRLDALRRDSSVTPLLALYNTDGSIHSHAFATSPTTSHQAPTGPTRAFARLEPLLSLTDPAEDSCSPGTSVTPASSFLSSLTAQPSFDLDEPTWLASASRVTLQKANMAAPSGPHSLVSDINMVPAEIGTDKTELSTPSQVYESPSYNVTAHTLNDHEQAPLGLDLHPQTSSSVDYSVGPPSPIEALRRFSARLIPRPSSNSTGRDHPENLPGVGERGGVVGEHPKVEGRDSTRINRARRPKTRPPTARSDPYEDENRKKYYRGSLFRSKSFTLREDSAQSAITSPSGSPASPLSSSYHTARDFYQLGLDARSSYYPDFTENSSFYTALEGNSVVHSPWPKRRDLADVHDSKFATHPRSGKRSGLPLSLSGDLEKSGRASGLAAEDSGLATSFSQSACDSQPRVYETWSARTIPSQSQLLASFYDYSPGRNPSRERAARQEHFTGSTAVSSKLLNGKVFTVPTKTRDGPSLSPFPYRRNVSRAASPASTPSSPHGKGRPRSLSNTSSPSLAMSVSTFGEAVSSPRHEAPDDGGCVSEGKDLSSELSESGRQMMATARAKVNQLKRRSSSLSLGRR